MEGLGRSLRPESVCLALVAVFTFACVTDELAGPGQTLLLDSEDHEYPVGEGGTYAIPTPADSWLALPTVTIWQDTGINFSDSVFADIRISGTLTFADGDNTCLPGTPTHKMPLNSALGPRGWYEDPQPIGDQRWWYSDTLRLVRPDNSTQLITPSLTTFQQPDTLTIGRLMRIGPGRLEVLQTAGGGGGSSSGPGGSCYEPAYLIFGTRTVSANSVIPITVGVGGTMADRSLRLESALDVEGTDEAVPSPTTAARSTGVLEGDSVDFVATTAYTLIAGQPTWAWHDGDTLTTPDPNLSGTPIPSCSGMLTCRYAPPLGGGRMHVSAVFQDPSGFASNHTDPLQVDSAFSVVLDCSPGSVVRADSVACTATWTPSTIQATEITFDWRFESDSVAVFPAATAKKFIPPRDVTHVAAGADSWVGQLVQGGTVRLKATWQTSTDSTQAALAVSNRADTLFADLKVELAHDTADIPTDYSVPLSQQPPPPGSDSLGSAGQNFDMGTGSADWTQIIQGAPVVTSVSGGPNQGYWYVTNPSVYADRGIRIRTWLTGRESPKFDYTPVAGLLTNRGLLQARRGGRNGRQVVHRDSLDLLTGVWAHEGRGSKGQRKGHQGQIEAAAKLLPPCGRVPEIMERVVADNQGFALVMAFTVKNEGSKSLAAASWHDYVYGNYRNAPFYEVVPQVTFADTLQNVVAVGDAQGTPQAAFAPDTLYDCTRTY